MVTISEQHPGKTSPVWHRIRDYFSSREEDKLPLRVREQLYARRARSEILIKIIQLSVFLVWAALYVVSPKTDDGTAFSPVPYALGGYLILNVIGLVWAIRWRLPDWAVYINVLIDMGVLMVLIWSFHIQYDQPPSFYLKAPTMLYVFIFIALRALRFEPRFVMAMGIAAALGWGVLTAYGVFAVPPGEESMVTRDYIEYMTSNSILIGAEVDKMIVIIMVTVILAVSLKRAQATLIAAVSEGSAARELSRFFDADVAEKIRGSHDELSSGQGVRRDAAILFVDIRGFTSSTSRQPPDEVVTMLTEYEKRLVPIIQKNGGVIDKFLGDGIMASFGAVEESDSYAADALRAIDEIMDESDSWANEEGPLKAIAGKRINAAAAAGPVIFGALGDEKRLEFTTIGATVNMAAKLEKHNKDAGSRAICDKHTYDTAIAQDYQGPKRKAVSQRLESVDEKMMLVTLHAA